MELDSLINYDKGYEIITKYINTYNINQIYFNYTLCFRGRIYVKGLISPTSDKLLRKSLSVPNSNHKLISFDATASMLQILAMITCSRKLMNIVNIGCKDSIDP
jgi:hypothetical protein